LKLRFGLLLYDLLAGFRNFARHRMLSAEGVAQAEPSLAREDLLGGATYYDAATDDARLTLANARAAAARGAAIITHARVTGITSDRDYGNITFRDELDHRDYSCRARIVVNATGPWSDEVITLLEPSHARLVRGTRGAHIAVPRQRIGNHNALTLIAPQDGRVFFVLPGGGSAIIGTTDTAGSDSPDSVRASVADVAYLLAAANHYFPQAHLTRDDVISAWAGLRPISASLYTGDEASASREHRLVWTRERMLNITGGKLTTYRVVARDAAAQIASRLGLVAKESDEPLPGGDMESRDAEIAAAVEAGTAPDIASCLVDCHGAEWRAVWRIARQEGLEERIDTGLPYILAQVVYAVRHEFAITPADVLMRRTHLAFETRDHGAAAAQRILPLAAAELGWSSAEQQKHLEGYSRELRRIFGGGEEQEEG
jgi:glycerol-3-phosphate dehydrogenase